MSSACCAVLGERVALGLDGPLVLRLLHVDGRSDVDALLEQRLHVGGIHFLAGDGDDDALAHVGRDVVEQLFVGRKANELVDVNTTHDLTS